MFVTAFTNAPHLSLPWTRSIQSIPPHPTYWRSIVILFSHQRLGLPSWLFPLNLSTKSQYAPLLCLVLNICAAHLIILNLMSLKIFEKECRSWSSYLRSLLRSPLTSSPLGPNVFLSTQFSNNLVSFCTMTNKYKIISQIITLLHVSTLSCHPQGACNQYLPNLHKYFKCSCS